MSILNLVIPASLLKDSFYNPNLPSYFNFATLGRAVAKEIFNLIFSDHFEFSDMGYPDSDRLESNLFENAVKCLLKEATYFHNYEVTVNIISHKLTFLNFLVKKPQKNKAVFS